MYNLYITLVYQPFFNLLLIIYHGLQQLPQLPHVDIGIAVIIFTLALRIILLPLTISGYRSEKERRQIEAAVKDIKLQYPNDPVRQKKLVRKQFLGNKRIIISEAITFTIQALIFFMLYRIFAKGLLGQDFNLLYDFMPQIQTPLKLSFLGKYDLTRPNMTLNIIQSIVIFAVELISILSSPFPTTKNDVIRLQLILPLASFLIFMNLPAGKKLFIITTLLFSFTFLSARLFRRFLRAKLFVSKPTPKE